MNRGRYILYFAPSSPAAASAPAETAQRSIQVRPPIAKHEPVVARLAHPSQVEARSNHPFDVLRGFGYQRPAGIGDERGTIEPDMQPLWILQRVLAAYAVAGDQGHQVGGGVTLLRALPMQPGIHRRVRGPQTAQLGGIKKKVQGQ